MTTPIRVTYKPERYNGNIIGMYWTCETIGCGPMGAVLGRASTEHGAIDDFIFRAKLDGHKTSHTDLELKERVDQHNNRLCEECQGNGHRFGGKGKGRCITCHEPQ